MIMKYSLLPVVLLSTMVVLCSAVQDSKVIARLTNESDIMNNGWMVLTCDAQKVGLSSNASVVQLELRRELTFSTADEMIASYRPPSQPNPGLSIGEKFKNDTRWTIKGYGQNLTGPTDSFYMTALVNKTLCHDAGSYSCYVNYTDKDTKEEKQIEGWMVLDSIAEITKIDLKGKINNRTNTRDVQKDDVITVDCYVKGPLYLNVAWQKDGKVIDAHNPPPEVLKVENRKAEPLSAGDCPQYQYHNTLVFKAISKTFRYQCAWNYNSRHGSGKFDIDTAKWKWSSHKKGDKSKSKGFNIWYVIAPVVAVVGLSLIGAGIYLVVSKNRRRLNLQGENARLIT